MRDILLINTPVLRKIMTNVTTIFFIFIIIESVICNVELFETRNIIIHKKNEGEFLNFLKLEERNNTIINNAKILILNMNIDNYKILMSFFDPKEGGKEYKLIIDTIDSDSFLFDQKEINKELKPSKVIFHSDFFYSNYQKNSNYPDINIKDFKNEKFWHIKDFLFYNLELKNLIFNSSINPTFINSYIYSTFLNEIADNNQNIKGTLSLSRESDEFEFFKKLNNENFESEDFVIDIENKKIVFGMLNEYKNANLTEIYFGKNKDGNFLKDDKLISEKEFAFCNYYDKDYLVLNKKRKFHNCFISYLFLGDNFVLNNQNLKENSVSEELISNNEKPKDKFIKPIKIGKMGIFDSFTKYILFPIEEMKEENISNFNYKLFYSNMLNEKFINTTNDKFSNNSEFYCFINENVPFLDDNLTINMLLTKKSLICLSNVEKKTILENSNEYFNKQNIILNTISFNLRLNYLLDEISLDHVKFAIKYGENEEIKFKNNNLTFEVKNLKDKLLNEINKYKIAYELNVAFYNSTSIQKIIEENKENIIKKDNIFEFNTNPVILGTSFFLGFDQIFFEESNRKINFYGGDFKDYKDVLDDPSGSRIFSSFIFSTLSVFGVILIFLLIPYYFYRRRKRLMMEKLQYEIIYKKMDDITKECSK